jgi:hypothetical protein
MDAPHHRLERGSKPGGGIMTLILAFIFGVAWFLIWADSRA